MRRAIVLVRLPLGTRYKRPIPAPGAPDYDTRGERLADCLGQEPFRRTSIGFETMDLVLDVVIHAEGRWRWKDEDELETFVERGVFDGALADRVQDEGLSVVRRAQRNEPPFSEPWPSWRPDPSWAMPELPQGWEGRWR